MRKHKEEMVRFAQSKEGTRIWVRDEDDRNWITIGVSSWFDDAIYIVDDEFAILRKAHVDGKEIEMLDNYGVWVKSNNPLWSFPINKYRLKPEVEYFYKYKRVRGGLLSITELMTDAHAKKFHYTDNDYIKIESSKTTYEELI